MIPPLVSFVTWNRMGLTVRNLTALLRTSDDFELHIIDSNSQDDTWEYIKQVEDPRIKTKTRLDANRGPVYTANFNLSKRRKDQFFITVDNDVYIYTSDWISRFMNAFEEFPEVGLLGAVSRDYYERYRQPYIKREGRDIFYLQLVKGFVEGCCQCIHPSVLKYLGYWSEETCLGDMELCYRVCNYTPYKIGFLPAIEIDQVQQIPCDKCQGQGLCTLNRYEKTCFTIRDKKYRNPQFRNTNNWKWKRFILDLKDGKRPVYCASIHDEQSLRDNYYDAKMAEGNFLYYINNSN